MKTKHFVIIAFVMIISWIVEVSYNEGYSYENGAPSSVSGSPADGLKTCAKSGCHTGSAVVNVPNIITSNVPPAGYTPGTTYTITATCVQSGINKWGFEISPQSSSGALLGQLIITNTAVAKIVSTKYVTQKTGGSSGNGSKTWSFDWVAPIAGKGPVTFYGTFNYANDNGSASGDHIKTSTLVIPENTGTTGILSQDTKGAGIDVFPNPVVNDFNIRMTLQERSHVIISLLDLNGKRIREFKNGEVEAGFFMDNYSVQGLASGIYLLTVNTGNKVQVKKISII